MINNISLFDDDDDIVTDYRCANREWVVLLHLSTRCKMPHLDKKKQAFKTTTTKKVSDFRPVCRRLYNFMRLIFIVFWWIVFQLSPAARSMMIEQLSDWWSGEKNKKKSGWQSMKRRVKKFNVVADQTSGTCSEEYSRERYEKSA